MSLVELTRNCFQSGISSSKWLGLCKLLISKEPLMHNNGPDDISRNISNSVLVLYRSYPGDPGLQDYLKHAIKDGIVPVAIYVATMLQAARSPELHTSATLDTLCRVALDAHYSSGMPPIGSIVPFGESPIVILGTVQDALALVRTAHSMSMSHFYQLTRSASELVIILLSCVSDMSQISTAQAMVHFADANDLVHNFDLSPDLRQVLETFLLSLTLLLGDDAKAARETQMMHTIQLTMAKGDILGPSSESDIITLSLILNHLMSNRAHEFGAGDTSKTAALLIGTYRWCSWSPSVFYTQLYLSAITCLSQSSWEALLWKSFIVGRLPYLLISFEAAVNLDKTTTLDWRGAMQTALMSIFRRPDLIVQCDHILSRVANSNSGSDDDSTRTFSRELLQNLLKLELIEQAFAVQIDPLISNDNVPARLLSDSQETDLSAHIESKLAPEVSVDDMRTWFDRISRDVGSHESFANVVYKRFSTLASAFDAESLSHLCKVLYTQESALDILALYIKISDLIFYSLLFLEDYDFETVGDPQTAVSHLGDVILFIQYTISRFQYKTSTFTVGTRTLSSVFLTSTDKIHTPDSLSPEETACFTAWFKALFDSSSEGIEDTIFRSTRPKTLLLISATLFSQAIRAFTIQKIDVDVLYNGVSYFTGPLLNWTLVGVIKAMTRELQHRGFMSAAHLEILQTLVLSPSCPRPVLQLCSSNIITLLPDRKGKFPPFDKVSVRRVLTEAVGIKDFGSTNNAPLLHGQPRRLLQETFAMARAQKCPVLHVEECLKYATPTEFLQTLWSELIISASLTELETCRRIATFVLAMPRSPKTPPLLPIFMHLVVPSLTTAIDRQQQPEQTMSIELLVSIISSVLTAAFHLEWALQSVHLDDQMVLGQPSTSMARRLVHDLRSRNVLHTNSVIARRLASSPSFVTNFPIFMNEMGN